MDDNDDNDENKSRSSQADRDAGRRELQGSNSATNTEAASTDDKSVSSKTISSKMDGKDYKNVSSKSVVSSKTEEYMPEKDIHDTTPAGATANSGFAVVEFTDVPDEELAVAVAINEEDDADKDYVYAIEYDPDAKPPFYQNRRFCFYAVGGFVVFLALAAILIVGTVVLSNKGETIVITLAPTPTPTQSPTKTKLGLYIERVSQELSTGDSSLTQTEAVELITQPDSPHIKTMDWMMNEDPMQLDETDKGFFQRYMMVFFYFSTTNSGEDEWRSCNPPTDGEPDTCTYLLSDDTTNIVPIPDRGRWLTGLDVCSWNGVLCAGGEDVLGIELFGQKLQGSLASELASLPFLQLIALPFNELTGTIPSELANLSHLRGLELHGNMLTGTIPEVFFADNQFSLILLNIGDNLFEGELDNRIGQMTDLKGLFLFENSFEGPLPSEIGLLNFLSYTRMNGNEFSGPIPSELGRLRQLTEFHFQENPFSGTIPSQLGNMARMQDFRLWGNQLSGTIPEELYNLNGLAFLEIRDTKLTGTLSASVGQLTNLVQLRLSNNQLTGPIPDQIQELGKLQLAWLQYNRFEGEVPPGICSSPQLVILNADCLPIDDPTNPCLCCTACCNREERECELTRRL